MTVTLPVVQQKVHLPSPELVAYYAGIGALAAFEVIDWPIALVVAAGHLLASRSQNRVAKGLGESAESS